MSLISLLGISTAYAAPAVEAANTAAQQQPQGGGLLGMLPMLIVFIVVFYFLLVRPQTKRAKQQREMLSSMKVGDEVVTAGGMIGKLAKIDEQFAELTIANGVTIRLQKASINGILPKGTLDGASDKNKTE